jgi:hypothetical protein
VAVAAGQQDVLQGWYLKVKRRGGGIYILLMGVKVSLSSQFHTHTRSP